MKLGIGFKLGVVLAVFGIMAISITGYYLYSSSRNMLTRTVESNLMATTNALGGNMKIIFDVIAEDAQLLAAMPAAKSAFHPTDELVAELGKETLADVFTAMLAAHPEYFQIRLISINGHCHEWVRIDRNGEKLIRVAADDLRNRNKYPYVTQTLRLAQGDIYLSDIDINHERGAHSALNKPSVTVSTPVFSKSGKRLGLIVINIDLNGLARLLKSKLPSSYQLYLSNQKGDFLIHPDETQTFGFDRGKPILIQDSFQDVSPLTLRKAVNVVTKIDGGNQRQDKYVAAFVRLPFGDTIDKRFVILGLAQPVEVITRETDKLGMHTIQIILIFSSLALILSALLSRIITGPLIALSAAIYRFSKDRGISTRPLMRKDEIGLLSRSFHDMQMEIVKYISELDESRKALDHLARHDTLTKLPNRRMFFDMLEHAIANSRRSGKQFAVLFVDLDGFKEINDTLGHAVGDGVLVSVANMLKSAVREVDTVARLGGDEFVILLDMIDDPHHVNTIAKKLFALFQQPQQVEGHQIAIHASMGASIFPKDGKNAEELMQNADQAMYGAKKHGKNAFEFYEGT